MDQIEKLKKKEVQNNKKCIEENATSKAIKLASASI